MGRLDFRPARVRQAVSVLLSTRRGVPKPAWYEALGDVPPPEILTRTVPVQHRPPPQTGRRRIRKASKMFSPQPIKYEEDTLRSEFFKDHPWELARPRLIIENDGKDYQRWDWSKESEPGRPIGGESVVQRQRHLMQEMIGPLTKQCLEALGPNATQAEKNRAADLAIEQARDKSYDQSRKELYRARHYDEIEARVAREEALACGAKFGATEIDIGMELENKMFHKWRLWADGEATLLEQARLAGYTATGQGAATLVDEVQTDTKESAAE